jgi:type IV pilus assembly protein PilX
MKTHARKQSGISLIVVMLFLLTMSILGVTAMRTANLEEKMAGNERDRQLAFEAAEAALRDAERDVNANITVGSAFFADCTGGLCLPPTNGDSVATTVNWNSGTPREFGVASGAGVYPFPVSRTPRYVVELLPDMPAASGESLNSRAVGVAGTPFRITATAWGRRATTLAQLQVVYVKR